MYLVTRHLRAYDLETQEVIAGGDSKVSLLWLHCISEWLQFASAGVSIDARGPLVNRLDGNKLEWSIKAQHVQ